MGAFLSYSILSGIILFTLYIGYRIFLEKENQPKYNRYILLAIYVVSFVTVPIVSLISELSTGGKIVSKGTIEIDSILMSTRIVTQPVWASIMLWIFIAGMMVGLIRTLLTWMRILKIIHSGERIDDAGFTLILTDNKDIAPFSWMRYIIMRREDFEKESTAILTHEWAHIRSYHCIDLLIAQIICIINWFNPAAWMMRNSLMLVHEFQADSAVIDGGYDTGAYQMILIKKAVGSRFPSLANSLNHSKLKKRITMMSKSKSGVGRKMRALFILPIFALSVGFITTPSVRAAVSTISDSDLTVGKDSKTSSAEQKVQIFRVKSLSNKGNVTTIVVRGENMGDKLSVSGGTFTTMGKTYKAKSLNCNLTDGVAIITATFPFTSEYENSTMTLNVNGVEIPINIEYLFNQNKPVTISGDLSEYISKGNCIVLSGADSYIPKEYTVYLNGKELKASEFDSIDTDNIANVKIDSEQHALMIITRK